MGFEHKYFCFLFVMVLWPALCASHEYSFSHSRATYYGSPDCLGTPSGACGLGEYGRTMSGGNVAGVSRLWKNGTGCGACYQVRCTVPKLCSEDGVNIAVTDHGEGDDTDFVLSPRAFSNLARSSTALDLFAYGVVDVEYRRVACQYRNNLVFRVHEQSRFGEYLAIMVLYQDEISAIELWQEDCKEWRGMRRAYGAVWDVANPPRGAIDLRFQVSGQKWVLVSNAIPRDWKAGYAYDSAIELP